MNTPQSTSGDDSDIENKPEEEEYIFKTNVCRRLSMVLDVDEMKHDEITYVPPKISGLANCNNIIPTYYKENLIPAKILDVDYFEIIKDDIKNCRILNSYKLKFIKDLSHEHKDELLDIYNECIMVFNDFIENHMNSFSQK